MVFQKKKRPILLNYGAKLMNFLFKCMLIKKKILSLQNKFIKKAFLKASRYIISLVFMAAVLAGCSSSRNLPEAKYLLERVELKSDIKGVDISTLEPYVRQKANSNWTSFLKIGKTAVIYDSIQAERSKDDLVQALRNQGYMHASVDMVTHTRRKKLILVYNLHPGVPFHINAIKYDIQDSIIAGILARYAEKHKTDKERLLQLGDRFTVSGLDAERSRITKILLDSGYYKFHKDFIQYAADSAKNDNGVTLTMQLLKYRANNDAPEILHPRYSIRKINFIGNDDGMPHLRRRVMNNATSLEEGKYFSDTDLKTTYGNFGRMSAVRYTNIKFKEVPDTSQLDCDIQLDTSRPSTIAFQPEGTNTAGDLGAAASITYQNRNLLRGSELFSLQLRGAFEAITGLEGYRDENFVEWSVESKLQFPRFIAPFLSRNFIRRSTASTELSVSYDMQNRPEFHRRVFSAAWRYRWSSPDKKLTYRIDVPDINYVYMPWISETFKHDYLDSVSNRNAILRYNYEDLFILRLGFALTYNNGIDAMRVNVETAGNVLDALASTMNFHTNNSNQHTLFGIAYAQYFKFDFDYTRLLRFDSRNTLALHGDFGIAYPYGNSSILPFEKRYFSGGANSVRGWSVRELGPGSYRGQDGRIDFINQTGDLKLDLNAEYRASLFWKFDGAVFIDAGNIWTLRNYQEQPGGQFKFSEFYKQIAVAYGLGLRLNFSYFILRFDFGMKAINPAYTNSHEHYAIFHPDFSRDFTFHFAVGLPF